MPHEEGPAGGGPAGPVVLDIGGDVGALVVHTGPERLGQEIEIEPAGHPERRTHVAVLERDGPAGSSFAAVYAALGAGRYMLLLEHPRDHISVGVIGGQVVELDCRHR